MKWFLTLFVVAAAAAGGYYFYSHRSAPQKPVAIVVPAEPLPPIAAGPAPAALVPQAPEKRFAPKGVYFLLMPISVTSDSGVVGIGQGAKVTLVSEKGKAPKTWRVTDGQTEFDVAPDHLTNDLDIADDLLKKTQDAQAANAGLRTQQQSTSDAQQMAQQKLAAFEAALRQQQAQRLQQQQSSVPSVVQSAQPASSAKPATSGKTSAGSSNGSVNSPFGRPQPF